MQLKSDQLYLSEKDGVKQETRRRSQKSWYVSPNRAEWACLYVVWVSGWATVSEDSGGRLWVFYGITRMAGFRAQNPVDKSSQYTSQKYHKRLTDHL